MRLQSHIWISAFMKKEMADGCYSTIIRKGASEAGAIFVVHNHLDGTCSVYSQAPQAIFADEPDLDRRFEKVQDHVAEDQAAEWLGKQSSFDPDCWIVETERKNGTPDLLVI
ncbi:MAG: DUF1491 family protein [Pseudomonadota bacterium]